MFRINEVFTSVQGEAFYTGTPAHFIRFQGCPIHCSFCDSQDTWSPYGGDSWTWRRMMDQLEEWSITYPYIKHVVITGGEPLFANDNLVRLIKCIINNFGWRIEIETSGAACDDSIAEFLYTEAVSSMDQICITVSPKTPKESFKNYMEVHPSILARCFQIKFPIADSGDIETRIPAFFCDSPFRENEENPHIWLQPVDYGDGLKNSYTTGLCMEEAMRRGWRVSAQTHKLLKIK